MSTPTAVIQSQFEVIRQSTADTKVHHIWACIMDTELVIAPLLLLAMIGIVEILEPGYDAIQQTVSQLALGRYGIVMTAVFHAFGVLFSTLSVRLNTSARHNVSVQIATILLFLIGICFILIGVFPTKSPQALHTTTSIIHLDAVYAIGIMFPIACMLIAWGSRRGSFYKTVLPHLVTSALTLVLMISFIVAGDGSLYEGLLERLLLTIGMTWIIVTSFNLLTSDIHDLERRLL